MERSDVFLSYRRVDVDFTKKLYSALKETGRELWVDWEDIPPGVEGFSDEIQRGIEGADAFICILSPSYLESEYCLMELREALRLKKRVIPIVLKKFEPLPPPEGIGHINWVYFTPHAGQKNKFEEAFPKVIEALEADYDYVREHTRLLLRAIDWDKAQRAKSLLLKDAEIEKAEHWQVAAINKNPAPTALHGEYVLLSRTVQRQQQRRLMAVIGVMLAFAVVAAIFAGFQWNSANLSASTAVAAKNEALTQQANAEIQQANAEKQRATAVAAEGMAVQQQQVAESERQNALISSLSAQSQLTQSHQLGILLALEAYNASLRKGEVTSAVQTSLRSALIDFSGVPVHAYTTNAQVVYYSPNDQWLVSASSSGQVQVSDLSQGLDADPITLVEAGGLSNIVMSPDSHWLAGIYNKPDAQEQEIWLWSFDDLTAPPVILGLPNSDASILTLAFGDPASKEYWLAVGLADGSIYTWNVPDLPNAQPTLFYHDRSGNSAVDMKFSPNGLWLAVAFVPDYASQTVVTGPFMLLWDMKNPANAPLPIDLYQANISNLTFSPSGKWLAGISDGSRLKLWNMKVVTESPAATVFDVGQINSLTLSPDDRWLVVTGINQAQVLDLRTLSNPINLPGYKDYVLTSGFSPDSQWLATGDWDGHVRLWNMGDVAQGGLSESQAQLFDGFDVIVNSLRFNSDGTQLVAAGDNQVRVWNFPVPISEPLRLKSLSNSTLKDWSLIMTNEYSLLGVDLKDKQPTVRISTVHKTPISYTVSSDESYVAVMSAKQLQVWDLNNVGKEPIFETELQTGQFSTVFFSEDNHWLLYAAGNQVYALELQNPGEPLALTGNRKVFPIQSLFSFDKWLISQSVGEILAWNLTSLTQAPTKLMAPTPDTYIQFYEEGSSWMTISQPGMIRVWNSADLTAAPLVIEAKASPMTILQDQWLAAFMDEDGTLRLWDLTKPATPPISFSAAVILDSQAWIVDSDPEGTVQLFNLNGSKIQTTSLGKFVVTAQVFSPDERWLALSVNKDDVPMLLVYDLTNNLAQLELPDLIPLTFSEDGHWLVLFDQESNLVVYDLQTGERLTETFPESNAISFSPNGDWLIGSTGNNATKELLVDLNAGQSYILTGHTDNINGGFFTPDQRWFMTYSYDGTARLWDLQDLSKDPVVLQHVESVGLPVMSQNGNYLITSTNNFTYIWRMDFDEVHDLACRLAGRNLTQAEWSKYLGSLEYRRTCEQWP